MTTSVEQRPNAWILALIGVIGGLMSGLFGIGGGIVLVPMLVALGFSQRLAAGTSVTAILPAGIAGGISYGVQGEVDWLAALGLAVGVVGGAQLGSFLLSRTPLKLLTWFFMAFLVVVAVSLWLVVPSRDAQIEMTAWTFVGLVGLGLFAGVLSGLLGIGGGVVVVPALMFFFGANDLMAKGTSLIMLIPGSLSGTVGNVMRRNVDLRAALFVGILAATASPFGTIIAGIFEPLWLNIAFSVLLAVVFLQMLLRMLKGKTE